MGAKNYLVVGGSTGIGLEIVKRLNGSGHYVTVVSRSRGSLDSFGDIEHIALDVIRDDFDSISLPDVLDGLVYCPGTIRLKPFRRLHSDELMEDLQVNFLGAVRAIQACLTRLRKAPEGGSVVLFSTVAVQTGMPFHASIAGAKGAVEGLTRSLAAELAPHIRFNAIAPSLTDTPLARELLSGEEKREAAARRHPMQRIGTPEEIAATAVHLLSKESRWMTGQVLAVDGGMAALRTFR